MLIIHGYSSSIMYMDDIHGWILSMDNVFVDKRKQRSRFYKQFDVPISCIYIHSAATLRHRHRAKNIVTK